MRVLFSKVCLGTLQRKSISVNIRLYDRISPTIRPDSRTLKNRPTSRITEYKPYIWCKNTGDQLIVSWPVCIHESWMIYRNFCYILSDYNIFRCTCHHYCTLMSYVSCVTNLILKELHEKSKYWVTLWTCFVNCNVFSSLSLTAILNL